MQAWFGGKVGRRDPTQKRRARHTDIAKRRCALEGWDRVSALGCEAKMLSADL